MDWANLFGHAGLGQISSGEFEELRKALSTGYDVGGTTQTGGGAFRLESLDAQLGVLTERAHEIVLLNDLPRGKATSTAIEYARRTALAPENGGFISEGELPVEADDTYDRAVAFVKYAGTLKNVTMQAQMVQKQ